jgi:DNA (cytosine-5)-methyltransferase 1
MISEKLKFIDLFCGMGGFRLALSSLNTSCVFSSDIHPQARSVYALNFQELPHGDITAISEKDIPEHDILCAGFPCQAFSKAGKMKGFEDSRGTLFFDIARIVKEHHPKILLLENVKNLLIHDHGNTFDVIKSVLQSMNYHLDYQVLNASDFGVAQHRERLVIIANNIGKHFDFSLLRKMPRVSMCDVLSDRGSSYLYEYDYTLLPQNHIKQQSSGLIFCGYRNKNIRITGVKPDTIHLSRVHKQPNRIYHIDGLHPTLSSQESSGRYFVKDDFGVRKLSVQDCLILMGYPSGYRCLPNMTSMYSRIGNSICVPMFEEIFKEIQCQFFN